MPAEGEMVRFVVGFSNEFSFSPRYVLMDAHVSIDVDGNVMLQTACNKSWWRQCHGSEQESIMVVGRFLCVWQVH